MTAVRREQIELGPQAYGIWRVRGLMVSFS